MTLKTSFPAPTGKAISSPDSRASLAGLVIRTAAGVPRAGILPRHANALASARASMGVDVAAFEAVVVRNGLPAFIANDGTVTVPIGSAPVANSRYDVVFAKQNEASSPFSDGNDNEIFDFVSGAASASPSEAAAIALVPAGGIPIASVLIPSTATTTQSSGVVVKQIFPYTALTGGPIWARLRTDVTALAGFAENTLAYCLENKRAYRFTGTTWRPDQAVVNIIPTSVSGAGVTVDADGLVTMAAGNSSLSINDLHSTEFSRFRFIVEALGNSASSDIRVRARNAGVDLTAANYSWAGSEETAAVGPNRVGAAADTAMRVGRAGVGGVGGATCEFEFHGPATTRGAKRIFAKSYDTDGYVQTLAGAVVNSGTFDGVTIFFGTGTGAMTVRIQGVV